MEELTFDANPTRHFFVSLLTKDIGTTDAILELIDNAISSAVTSDSIDVVEAYNNGDTPLDEYRIELRAGDNRFQISDNCGGISVDEARVSVFQFGNIENVPGLGLSVFGIGMKRACFKLGGKITIESIQADADAGFRVIWSVDDWAEETGPWRIPAQLVSRSELTLINSASGTTVLIEDLRSTSAPLISSVSFSNEFRSRAAEAYMLFLKAGLTIAFNDKLVEPRLPEFGTTENLRTANQRLAIDKVYVHLAVGITPRDDREPRGWYVFCNGRAVLLADKTELTGWGDVLPQFHTKYNHFLGFAFFNSRHPALLPWTTTKQGIVKDGYIYREALGHMERLARPVLKLLSDAYSSDPEMDPDFERAILGKAEAVPLDLTEPDSVFTAPWRKPSGPALGRIQYSKLKTEIDALKRALKTPSMSNKLLGERTFDIVMQIHGLDAEEQ